MNRRIEPSDYWSGVEAELAALTGLTPDEAMAGLHAHFHEHDGEGRHAHTHRDGDSATDHAHSSKLERPPRIP